MAECGSLAFVRSYLQERWTADARAGLKARNAILELVREPKHPAAAALLASIHEFDTALVESEAALVIETRRRAALDELTAFEEKLASENIVPFSRKHTHGI